MPQVLLIAGTRPEAIKMAPVLHALHRSESLTPVLCSTGQHDQVYETVRRYGRDSGEIWHRMQKTLPGDLAIQTR